MESALKCAPLRVVPAGLGAGAQKGGGAGEEVEGAERFQKGEVGRVGGEFRGALGETWDKKGSSETSGGGE